MFISKKNILFLAAGFFVLSGLKVLNFIPDFLGIFLFIFYLIFLFVCLDPILDYFKIPLDIFVKTLCLLAYCSVTLSLIYYTIGLNRFSVLIWCFFNFIIIFIWYFFGQIKDLKIDILAIKNCSRNFKNWEFWVIFIILASLIGYFFINPIISGSPTPWPKYFLIGFILFFIATLLLLRTLILEKDNLILSFLYFFLITNVIASRYVLSYGYDTLIHQGSLKYILEYGQIEPLTPFYIGQYVLEILLSLFSGLSFTYIERWLGPFLFFVLIFFGGRYFLKRLKINANYLLIPISVILLFPNIFSYTSPYALSLLWGIIAVLFLFLFFTQKNKTDLRLAVMCSTVSFFIHPFVGLNILIWSIGLWFFNKYSIKNHKNKFLFWLIFILASLAVIFAFILYNWLRDKSLNIYNPVYFVGNFASIFSDPVWYLRGEYAWYLGLIYFYEKIHFFLIFFLALYWPIKKLEKGREIVALISISALVSAWLFVSSFKIDNYFYGDQINYGYRLIQVGKWFLWPIVLILLSLFFTYLKKVQIIYRYLIIIFLSIIITISWYLSYPRQDDISHMNVNSISELDYQAIELIFKNENGKNGYLVLSNQIFGAGAILKHGFGPYYKVGDEDIFYYSLPWGGKLSNIYNRIMGEETGNISIYLQQLEDIKEVSGVNKLYFIYTNAWAPAPKVIKKLNYLSVKHWSIDNKIFIFLIKI